MATTNINLTEIAQSQTFGEWLEAFNENMGTIDGLPIPIEYGKNTTMEYLKLSNGKIIMWGKIDHGTKYPCNSPSNRNYISSTFTIDFPIALVNNNPTVIATVQASKWSDCWFLQRTTTYTNVTGCYMCIGNDSNASNSKSLNIIAIGDWK